MVGRAEWEMLMDTLNVNLNKFYGDTIDKATINEVLALFPGWYYSRFSVVGEAFVRPMDARTAAQYAVLHKGKWLGFAENGIDEYIVPVIYEGDSPIAAIVACQLAEERNDNPATNIRPAPRVAPRGSV